MSNGEKRQNQTIKSTENLTNRISQNRERKISVWEEIIKLFGKVFGSEEYKFLF
jgi:hypothetical protein